MLRKVTSCSAGCASSDVDRAERELTPFDNHQSPTLLPLLSSSSSTAILFFFICYNNISLHNAVEFESCSPASAAAECMYSLSHQPRGTATGCAGIQQKQRQSTAAAWPGHSGDQGIHPASSRVETVHEASSRACNATLPAAAIPRVSWWQASSFIGGSSFLLCLYSVAAYAALPHTSQCPQLGSTKARRHTVA